MHDVEIPLRSPQQPPAPQLLCPQRSASGPEHFIAWIGKIVLRESDGTTIEADLMLSPRQTLRVTSSGRRAMQNAHTGFTRDLQQKLLFQDRPGMT